MKLFKKTIPLIVTEEDYQDLLSICIDLFHYLDNEEKEEKVKKILLKRAHLHFEGTVSTKDPSIQELMAILTK